MLPIYTRRSKLLFNLFPLMTSKTYFLIGSIFLGMYVLTTFAVLVGVPEWAHQVCTIVFAGALFSRELKRRSKKACSSESRLPKRWFKQLLSRGQGLIRARYRSLK